MRYKCTVGELSDNKTKCNAQIGVLHYTEIGVERVNPFAMQGRTLPFEAFVIARLNIF
jgi:hypothetical protein